MKKKILFILIAILCLGINVNAKEVTEDLKLTSNITDGIYVPEGKTVEIDLNDYNITGVTNGIATIYNEGTLTITGLGNITNNEAITDEGPYLIVNKGNLIIENGIYEGGRYNLLNDGKATIKGGSFTRRGETNISIMNNKTLSISNAVVNNQIVSNDNITVKSGTLKGVVTVIGEGLIKGGNITVNLIIDGAGSEVTIEDGTIASLATKSTSVLNILNATVTGTIQAMENSKINISDGNYNGSLTMRGNGTFIVSGGVYTHNLTNDLLAPGYVVRQRSDSKYIVIDPNNLNVKMVKEALDNLVEEEESIVEAAIKDEEYVIGTSYDVQIKEYYNNEEVGTISETSEELEVTLDIPRELQNVPENTEREFAIVRVHEGVADILDTTDNGDGTLTAKSNLFSTYIITYRDTQLAGNNQGNNNSNNNTINYREEDSNTNVTNPLTKDNIWVYVVVLVLSSLSLLVTREVLKSN